MILLSFYQLGPFLPSFFRLSSLCSVLFFPENRNFVTFNPPRVSYYVSSLVSFYIRTKCCRFFPKKLRRFRKYFSVKDDFSPKQIFEASAGRLSNVQRRKQSIHLQMYRPHRQFIQFGGKLISKLIASFIENFPPETVTKYH